MMSVYEYALDVDKTPEEILKLAISLGFDVKDMDDLLDDYMITELDSAIASGNNLEEVIEEEIAELEENISKEEQIKEKHKVSNPAKKKPFNNKKDLAIKISSNQYGYDQNNLILTLPYYYLSFFLDNLQKGVINED